MRNEEDQQPAFRKLTLKSLGKLRASIEGVEVQPRHSQSELLLLVILCLENAGSLERSHLIERLWPSGEDNLAETLTNLRRALGDQKFRLSSGRGPLSLMMSSLDEVDVLSFEIAAKARDFRTAIDLYQGDFLPGVETHWAHSKRLELQTLYLNVIKASADFASTIGDFESAIPLWRKGISIDGFWEEGVRGLMRAQADCGETGQSLVTYRKFVDGLQRRFRAIPGEETRRLAQSIQQGRYEANCPIAKPGAVRGNMPPGPVDIIGQDNTVAEICTRLREARLITLTGPIGVGKTTVGLRAAEVIANDFLSGRWFVSLTSARTRGDVLREIGRVFLAPGHPGVTDYDELAAYVRRFYGLQPGRMLLLVDNGGHVAAFLAEALGEILSLLPSLHIIATSRQRLGAPGETIVRISPLAVPKHCDIDEGDERGARRLAQRSSACRLFLRIWKPVAADRISAGDLQTVCSICVRLAGLPLAIEIAAGVAKTIPLRTVAENLFGLLTTGAAPTSGPHGRLSRTIRWSYDLLAPEDRMILRRASIFADPFTVDAARDLAENPDDATGHIHSLSRLVELSMLDFDPGTSLYWFLEPIRRFALQELKASGEESEIRSRFIRHVTELTVVAEPELRGPNQEDWIVHLASRHNDILAALDWATASGNTEPALVITGNLWRYWWFTGHIDRAAERAERLLNSDPERQCPVFNRAICCAGLLGILHPQNRISPEWLEKGCGWLERGLALWRSANAPRGIAFALTCLALADQYRGHFEKCVDTIEQAIPNWIQSGDIDGHAFALNILGDSYCLLRWYTEATDAHEQSLRLWRKSPNRRGYCVALRRAGLSKLLEGDTPRAYGHYEESLRIAMLGKYNLATAVDGLACVAADAGLPLAAVRLFCVGEVVAASDAHDGNWRLYETVYGAYRESAKAQVDRAVYDLESKNALRMTPSDVLALAREIAGRLRII